MEMSNVSWMVQSNPTKYAIIIKKLEVTLFPTSCQGSILSLDI